MCNLLNPVALFFPVILLYACACRWLADFETDNHKKCVLHKARAKRVEPLLKKFDRSESPDVYKTLQLDVGNSYKEITEIKFEMGRPFDKVCRNDLSPLQCPVLLELPDPIPTL
jgi:hypothetical protein